MILIYFLYEIFNKLNFMTLIVNEIYGRNKKQRKKIKSKKKKSQKRAKKRAKKIGFNTKIR